MIDFIGNMLATGSDHNPVLVDKDFDEENLINIINLKLSD